MAGANVRWQRRSLPSVIVVGFVCCVILIRLPSSTSQLQGSTIFGGTQQSFFQGPFSQFFSPPPAASVTNPGASSFFARQAQIQQQQVQRLQQAQQQQRALSQRPGPNVVDNRQTFFPRPPQQFTPILPSTQSFGNGGNANFNTVPDTRGPPNSPRFAKRPDWRPSPTPQPISAPSPTPGPVASPRLTGRSRFPSQQATSKNSVGFPPSSAGAGFPPTAPPKNSVAVRNEPRDSVRISPPSFGAGFLTDLYAHVQAVRFHDEGLFDLEQRKEAERQQPATFSTPNPPSPPPPPPSSSLPPPRQLIVKQSDIGETEGKHTTSEKVETVDFAGIAAEVSTEPHPTTIPSNVQVSVVDIPLSTDIPLFGDLFDNRRDTATQKPETTEENDATSPKTESTSANQSTERTKWAPPKPLPPTKSPTSGIISPLLNKAKVDAAAAAANSTPSSSTSTTESTTIASTADSDERASADLQRILATIDAEDLSKFLPPGIKIVSVDDSTSSSAATTTTPASTTSVSPTASPDASSTTYPVVTRRTKKLPFSFGSGTPVRAEKKEQTVGDAISSLFGAGGSFGGPRGKSERKLPGEKTVGELLGEIDFGSAPGEEGLDPALLPKDFTPEPTTTTVKTTVKPTAKPAETKFDLSSLFKEVGGNELKNFLPPDFKLTTTTTPAPTSATVDVKQLELLLKSLNNSASGGDLRAILASLVPVTSPPSTTTPSTTKATAEVPKVVFKELDLSLLPPGFNLKPEKVEKPSVVPVDISALLPPGFNQTSASSGEATEKPDEDKQPSWLVFPGGARTRKPILTTTTNRPTIKPLGVTFGFPKRPTTEFTGWPTEATSPVTTQSSTTPTSTSTTTEGTTTTTTPPTTTTFRSTTPAICGVDCRVGASIRIINGADWSPALWDRNSRVYRELSNSLEEELDAVYRNSVLADWYGRVEIEAFSPGSVVVDYVVWLKDLEKRKVDTIQLRKHFFKAVEGLNTRQSRKHDDSAPKGIHLGPYTLDAGYTEFVVLKEEVRAPPAEENAGYNLPLPQWAIAVIVIGSASLIFILAFGVTMLVNRRKTSKKRSNKHTPLTDDMLNELSKDHMSPAGLVGSEQPNYDSMYGMDADFDGFDAWHHRHAPFAMDTKYPASLGSRGRIPKIAKLHHRGMYDSWRTDWSGFAAANAYPGTPPPRAASPASTTAYRMYASRRPPDYDTEF